MEPSKNNKLTKFDMYSYLYLFFFLCFMFSMLFDIGITFQNYSKDPSKFIFLEEHKSLVAELNAGVPFFRTFSIAFNLLLILFFQVLLFYFEHPTIKKLKYIRIFLMLSMCFVMSYSSIGHFMGGLSWLR